MDVKKYIIAILCTEEGWISLKNFLQRQKNRQLQNHEEEPLFIHVIRGKVLEEKIVCIQRSTPVQWVSVDQWTPDSIHVFEEADQSTDTSIKEDDVSEVLHTITDTLPYTGSLVDVICELPSTTADERSENFLPLFGALRRLKDWHNAQIITVHINTDFMQNYHGDTSQGHDLFTSLLGAKLVGCFEDLYAAEKPHLWRGKVSMIDKMVNRGFILSGFALKPKGETNLDKFRNNQDGMVTGRMLEVLDEVDVTTIPVYMLTTTHYLLSLYDTRPQSQAFMNLLQGNLATGLITRMACYKSTTEIPGCGDRHLNTSTWKESIIADITFVQEPEEELLDEHEFMYLLLTLPDPELDDTCQSSLVATKLRPPKELNGGFISHLCNNTNQMAKTLKLGGNDVPIDLSTLPYLDTNIVNDIHQMLSDIETKLLTEWLALRKEKLEPTVVRVEELKQFLAEIQEIFLQNLQLEKCEMDEEDVVISVEGCKSEVDINPSDWVERKLLIYRESQKHTLSRLQSTDSVAMSSPIQISNEPATSLDVKDLLKLFRADATAVADNLSPVRKRHPSRCKKTVVPTSNDLETEVIPNFLDSCYHDSYYNRDRKTEKFENHNNKLRDRWIQEETVSFSSSSSFSLSQKQRKSESKSTNPRGRSTEMTVKTHGRRELKTSKLKSLLKSPRKSGTSLSQSALRKSPRKSVLGRSDQLSSVRRSPRKSVTSSTDSQLSQKSHLFDEKHRRHSLSSQILNNTESKPKRRSGSGSLSELNRSKETADRNEAEEPEGGRRKSLDGTARVSRSERHKRRLEDIVKDVLINNGVTECSDIYKPCAIKLFKVTKLFVMDLPTSENLKQEMRRIAEGQVQQVVDMETRKQQKGGKGQKQPG